MPREGTKARPTETVPGEIDPNAEAYAVPDSGERREGASVVPIPEGAKVERNVRVTCHVWTGAVVCASARLADSPSVKGAVDGLPRPISHTL